MINDNSNSVLERSKLTIKMKQPDNQKQRVLGWMMLFVSVVLMVSQGCNSASNSKPENSPATDGQFTSPEDLDRTLKQHGWDGFHHPLASNDKMGLDFSDGYQAGKVPVVFIHGLLSDPLTWHEMISALRSDPEISDTHQFWKFRYPTGETYLKAAADLRTALADARVSFDPTGSEKALEQMVLVGHSMGGLVAKLQVTHSEQKLWQAVSKVPIKDLKISAENRAELERIVLFEPLPFVNRVVFIATPHGGSLVVHRVIGKIARGLIDFPDAVRNDFDNFLDENEGVFKGKSAKIPTSLDHLSPLSPILKVTQQLEVASNIELYSIIGTGTGIQSISRGDGAVSRKSASIQGVVDETFVHAKHVDVHHHPDTIEKIKSVLSTSFEQPVTLNRTK